jgi:Protein ChrB, N-terminal
VEWLLFTYWLPPEPSRRRVFVWRQLKRIGALSMEGGGWILPKIESPSAKVADLIHTVEEMGGTANLFTITHFSDTQETRTIARFQEERQQEYIEIIKECRKTLRHIEREIQEEQFNLSEVEEIEGDLGKINHWFSHVKKRDFWENDTRKEVEKLVNEIETKLSAFTQKTYDKLQGTENRET